MDRDASMVVAGRSIGLVAAPRNRVEVERRAAILWTGKGIAIV